MKEKQPLKERVELFNTMSLPGQPMMMHMGTCYLVNDLWTEVLRLREEVRKASFNPSLDESLNSGDGSYRP
jgi:hypothetical protein